MIKLKKTLATTLLILIHLACPIIAKPTAPPPNVILIMADDLGYETIAANEGRSYKTPHIDQLAADGLRFKHCYAQPLCTPSRVKIMTGQYNVRNYRKFGVLPRGEITFAHQLKAKGYATCIAGKWQLGQEKDAPQHFGFDESFLWQHTRSGRQKMDGKRIDKRFENPNLEKNGVPTDFENGEYAPDILTDFICDFIARKKEQPFLVYYPMILTHCPFVPTPASDDWDPKSPGSPTYKGKAKYFADMVERTDYLVGRIVAEVEKQGLADNTVILFTGDNGTDQPVVSDLAGRKVAGGKGKMTDAGTRVPLIVRGPGFAKDTILEDLVDFSDFLPTLCDITGADLPPAYPGDGQSFLPQLQGKAGEPRNSIYCWYSKAGKDETAKVFARNQRYKLYRSGKLYDLSTDVLEKSPLEPNSLTPEQKQIHAMLQAVIDQYQKIKRS